MARGKPFEKGDARINRKGRPKAFDGYRALAQQIAHEEALSRGEPVVINGHKVTVTEAILRQWAQSKDPRLQMQFMKVAYGEEAIVTKHTGADGNEIIFRVIRE